MIASILGLVIVTGWMAELATVRASIMREAFEPFLSHYTDRAGLEGIAKGKSFWATNFLDLNDASEFVYAWSILAQDAVGLALEQIPTDVKRADFDLSIETAKLAGRLKETLRKSDGYNSLYVVSFARARTEDQDQRGILTLWDRYTRHKGYCLQFSPERN